MTSIGMSVGLSEILAAIITTSVHYVFIKVNNQQIPTTRTTNTVNKLLGNSALPYFVSVYFFV